MSHNKQRKVNRILKSKSIEMLFDKMDDGTFSGFFSDWKWIFSYSKRYKGIIVLYTVIGIFGSSFALAASYIGKDLINIIIGREQSQLWLLVIAMIISTVFSLVFKSVMSRISARVSVYVTNDIQSGIFDRIIDAEWAELNKYQNGDLLNRFNNDIHTIASNSINWIPNLIINIYTFTVTFIVLLKMDVAMAFIAVTAAPFLMLSSRFIMRKMKEYKQEVLKTNSDIMSFEVDTFFNMDMIKSFGVMGYYSKKLREWQKKYKDTNLEYNKFEIKADILMTALSTLVALIAFGYCLYRLWTGQILFGDMTFFLEQRSGLTGKFNALAGTFPSMMNSAVSAHRVRELTELKKEKHNHEASERLEKIISDGISIEIENISFSYDGENEIFADSSIKVRPGETVAVLGISGDGKTTLLRLILGLIRPEKGNVYITGRDGIKTEPVADIRKFISYVPQENGIISGSIAENLRMVKEDASDEEIICALQTACAWNFINNLPDGINTIVRNNSKGLSMGQIQRITIARALLRDAPILLLDEATSALDAETEEKLLKNICENYSSKTVVISTHRPAVLKLCTKVFKIDNKKIIISD